MSKPPTSQRGRQPRPAQGPPPPPPTRPLLRRFVAGRQPAALAEPAGRRGAGREGSAPGNGNGHGHAAAADRLVAGRDVGEDLAGNDDDLEQPDAGYAEDGTAARRPWRPIATGLLSLIGLGVSVYLTIAHYAHYSLICSDTSIINCAQVTHSPQSYVFGIPVAVLGLVFFVPMVALCSPWAWRSASRLVAPARLGGLIVGVGFVFYLIYNELFVIGKICLDCSFVHLVTLLLFVAVVTGWEEAVRPARAAATGAGSSRIDRVLDRLIGA